MLVVSSLVWLMIVSFDPIFIGQIVILVPCGWWILAGMFVVTYTEFTKLSKEIGEIVDINETTWIPWRKYGWQKRDISCIVGLGVLYWYHLLFIHSNVKNIKKLSEHELKRSLKTSWHDQYKDSAWIFVGGLPYDLTEGDVVCVFSQ